MSHQGGGPRHSDQPTSFGLQPPQPGVPVQANPYVRQPQQPQSPQAAPPPESTPTVSVPEAPREPGAGRLIAGRYRLLSKLGHGGMGTVWRAKDETVDREVAVKEPRVPDHLPERERANAFERMRREARAAARLDHPSVVNVHDVAVVDGQPWIVMELVRGRSLGAALQEGTLGVQEAARIGLEVLGALEAAHAAGILHRDVKPDNVLLGRHDRVVLTDFGIAQIEGETNLTDTGGFVGSPEYTAPERVLGRRPGPEADLWSLGVVLYAATEGVSPFRRTNPPATLQSVLNSTPAAPAAARGPLADAINGLLEKDPARRPKAAEVRRLLEEAATPPQPTQPIQFAVPAVPAAAPAVSGGSGGGIRIGRRTLIGLGAGIVAVAVAAYLVIAKPFAGPLPDHWKKHPEKALGATVAVPEKYQAIRPKKDARDENWVTYADPSGGIRVVLELTKKSDDSTDKIKDSSMAEMYADSDEFRDSGSYELDMPKGPKMVRKETKYHGRQAAENTVSYMTDDNDNPSPRELKIFYYKDSAGNMYKLTIGYPGDGDFTARGREVADAAIANLEIDRP
ncbi:serine/threonine protein kinase [Streptomyces sp. RY43-2]|uniref:non-specific serine/threonine protein kinase n=1 Tax=Streptomyces macrolidinus TaxID=2952607 RepID=A0ABT0ZD19_9ACTN|nr:serine/threonine-protein kinase [Streptomyces macrolidinus]MCN9241479.1 serine/threonine protein kinase [Streptomyces macrolidinus]